MAIIPIDIVNIILQYVAEVNNNMIITQYHPITNKEYYKINFYSDSLWRIKSTLIMKRIYPIYSYNFFKKGNELYICGIPHYEKKLREKKYSKKIT